MENCLKTQLKGTVNNSNLEKLGCINVILPASDNVLYVSPTYNTKNYSLRIIAGNGYFTNNSGDQNLGTEKQVSADSQSANYYKAVTDIILEISEKYTLKRLANSGGTVKVKAEVIDKLYSFGLRTVVGEIEGECDLTGKAISFSGTSSNNGAIHGSGLKGSFDAALSTLNGTYVFNNDVQSIIFANNALTCDISAIPYVNKTTNLCFWEGYGKSYNWKGTRTGTIIGMQNCDFGIDLDAMLINQADLDVHSSAYTNEKIINVSGTRTSASDTAVTTLKSKGITVIVNGETL